MTGSAGWMIGGRICQRLLSFRCLGHAYDEIVDAGSWIVVVVRPLQALPNGLLGFWSVVE